MRAKILGVSLYSIIDLSARGQIQRERMGGINRGGGARVLREGGLVGTSTYWRLMIAGLFGKSNKPRSRNS